MIVKLSTGSGPLSSASRGRRVSTRWKPPQALGIAMGDHLCRCVGQLLQRAAPEPDLAKVTRPPVGGDNVVERKDEPVWMGSQHRLPLARQACGLEHVRPRLPAAMRSYGSRHRGQKVDVSVVGDQAPYFGG